MKNETRAVEQSERDERHFRRRYPQRRSDPAQPLFDFMGTKESQEHWQSPGLQERNTTRKGVVQTNLKPGHQS
jgi:hypothetical protein